MSWENCDRITQKISYSGRFYAADLPGVHSSENDDKEGKLYGESCSADISSLLI